MLGHDLLQGHCFRSQFFDLGRRCLTGRVTRQAVLPSFKELLLPGIIQALGDALAATQRGDTLLATQARQDDPDLLLGRIVLACLALYASDQLVSGILRCSGFLLHLRSIIASMNQNPPLGKPLNLSGGR